VPRPQTGATSLLPRAYALLPPAADVRREAFAHAELVTSTSLDERFHYGPPWAFRRRGRDLRVAVIVGLIAVIGTHGS
jgi:hypothetical protein